MFEKIKLDSIDWIVWHVREYFDVGLCSLRILLFELLEDIDYSVVSVLHDIEEIAFSFLCFEANTNHTCVKEFFQFVQLKNELLGYFLTNCFSL